MTWLLREVQVDPVTIIVAALVAGAASGTSEVTSTAVRDTYTGLRDALKRRLAKRRGEADADALLETASTDTPADREQLAKALAEAQAGEDADTMAAAQRLLKLLDPSNSANGKYTVDLRDAKGVQVGDGNNQHNTFS